MIRANLIIAFLAGTISGFAQLFQPQWETQLPDSLGYHQIEWADFDNDTLLDVFVSGKGTEGTATLLIYKGSPVTGLSFRTAIHARGNLLSFELVDFDGDNQMDIAVSSMDGSAGKTSVYINQGNFAFQNQDIVQKAGSEIHFADLDRDGINELIIGGVNQSPSVTVYKNIAGAWQVANDSIRINTTSIETFDYENDGDQDLFVSGTDENNEPVSNVYVNQRKFYLKELVSAPLRGLASVSDLNHDGLLDIGVAGADDIGKRSSVFLSAGDGFQIHDTIPQLNDGRIFSGDLDGDGQADLSIMGTEDDGDTVNLVVFAGGEYDTLDSRFVRSQAFGDLDRDGNLDLVQVLDATEKKISVFRNQTTDANAAPLKPFNPVSAVIFGHVFLYWERPSDDDTPKESLTYDVNIRGEGGDLLSANFDQLNYERLVVRHGNAGTANFVLFEAAVSSFDFAIQSVDNAYHASSACVGGAGCTEIAFKDLRPCLGEQVLLTGSPNAVWFSFDRGYIGAGPSANFTASQADTVISVVPSQGSSCAMVMVYTIGIAASTSSYEVTRHVCQGVDLTFIAEPGFTPEWTSSARGFLSNNNNISVKATADETITLEMTNVSGCVAVRTTHLVISKPVLLIPTEAIQLVKGESVQLQAEGEGSFSWAPVGSLDNPLVNNPIATPLQSTEYAVTLTDSVGCTAMGKVLVIVEQTAFVPNLFTPNEDGRNDALKIYGLQDAQNFHFRIFNREGSLVYSAENVPDITNAGWDGTVRGVRQPGGVYYWNISGEASDGTKILLNGKTSGSIVLIR